MIFHMYSIDSPSQFSSSNTSITSSSFTDLHTKDLGCLSLAKSKPVLDYFPLNLLQPNIPTACLANFIHVFCPYLFQTLYVFYIYMGYNGWRGMSVGGGFVAREVIGTHT